MRTKPGPVGASARSLTHHVLPYSPPFSAAAYGHVTKFITYGTIYSGKVPNAQPSDSPIYPFSSIAT